MLIIIPTGIKKIPPIVGVPCFTKWFFGPSSLMICLILIFFNWEIPRKVVNDDNNVVIRKGITKLLFGKFKSTMKQTYVINIKKRIIWLLIILKNGIFFGSKIFLNLSNI